MSFLYCNAPRSPHASQQKPDLEDNYCELCHGVFERQQLRGLVFKHCEERNHMVCLDCAAGLPRIISCIFCAGSPTSSSIGKFDAKMTTGKMIRIAVSCNTPRVIQRKTEKVTKIKKAKSFKKVQKGLSNNFFPEFE